MSLEKTKKQLIELLENADNKVIALSGMTLVLRAFKESMFHRRVSRVRIV